MTLDEVVKRLRMPPKKGAHEIVVGPDGLNHLVIITDVHDLADPKGVIREYGFMSWCGAMNNCTSDQLEVVKDASITCIKCMQWRTT